MDRNEDPVEVSILNLNRTAMSLLRDSKYSKALNSLKEASSLVNSLSQVDKKLKLQGITLNNFGCFYKRSKMPNVALKYLTQACNREKVAAVDSVDLAATHLNMCAIYSELNKHEQALEEGLKALSLMKLSIEYSPNFISTLVIAYHNSGVEYEFLKLYKDAFECYKTAWDTSEKYLGASHPLTISMKKNYFNADKKVQTNEMRTITRELNKKEPVPRLTKPIRFRSAGKRPLSLGQTMNIEENLQKSIKTPRSIVKTAVKLNQSANLENLRFLTGDRLQPMYKNNFRMKSLPRASIKVPQESHNSYTRSQLPQSRPLKHAEKAKKYDLNISAFESSLHPSDSANQESIEKMMLKHHKETAALKIQKNFRGYVVRKLTNALRPKSQPSTFDILEELESLRLQSELLQKPALEQSMNYSLEIIPEIPDVPTPANEDYPPDPVKCTQSSFRGYLTRNQFKRLINAAIVIQKHVRGYQCLLIYKAIKEAVVCIQAAYRGYSIRKKLKS